MSARAPIERIGRHYIHPAATLFPLVEGAEFESLCRDIQEHGLIEPILRTRVGRRWLILDGRNRLRACLAVGVEPRFDAFDGDDAFERVWSLNRERRHLPPGQVAALRLAWEEARGRWEATSAEGAPGEHQRGAETVGDTSIAHRIEHRSGAPPNAVHPRSLGRGRRGHHAEGDHAPSRGTRTAREGLRGRYDAGTGVPRAGALQGGRSGPCPGSRAELFAREQREGWVVWGSEAG